MTEFFREIAAQITDPTKRQITVRELLRMRAGYPWKEADLALTEAPWSGDYLPLIVHLPLASDPGAEFHSTNLTSDWLGVFVPRVCDTDLKSFAQAHFLTPLDAEVGARTQDGDG